MLAVQSVYGAADGVPRKALKVAEAEVILPRTALRPVKSLIDSDAVPLDTLDTGNESVKVVLYSNNTWRYLKDLSRTVDSGIFQENWDETVTNPYKIPLDSLPVSWRRIFTGVWPGNICITRLIWRNRGLPALSSRR